jgi:hypothetical protein
MVVLLSAASLSGDARGQDATKFRSVVDGSAGLLHNYKDGLGASVTASYRIASEFIGLQMTPLDLGVIPSTDDRFSYEASTSGGMDCRDRSSGQVVGKPFCQPKLIYAAGVEGLAAHRVGNGRALAGGVGVRFGNSRGIYGSGSWFSAPMNGKSWRVTLRVGGAFWDLGLGGSVPWPST